MRLNWLIAINAALENEMNIRKTLAAAALLLASVGVAAADPIPNRYKFDYIFVQKLFGRPYYKCDFTSRTCFRGVAGLGMVVGEILAEDRETVIGHALWGNDVYIDYETGQGRMGPMVGTFSDIPESCLDRVPGPGQGSGVQPCSPSTRSWPISEMKPQR